jgi:hypothetical protein
VVKESGDADAILGGILSVRVLGGSSKACAIMTLKDKTGGVLWSGSFTESLFKLTSNDEVKNPAADVAKKLRDDVRKAAERGKQKPFALK